MRWPWQSRETREAVGGYTEIISRLVEAQAAGTTQLASATAATEATAGLLSRSLAGAMVEGPGDVAGIVTPRCLAQVGRDLIRVGESLHVLRYMGGRLLLIPASTWYWEGDADPATWLCTATASGQADRARGVCRNRRSCLLPGDRRPPGPSMDSHRQAGRPIPPG